MPVPYPGGTTPPWGPPPATRRVFSVGRKGPIPRPRMAKFRDIVEIEDRPWNRAVKVTITAPALEGVDVQGLAQRAWRSPAKKIIEGPITVKVAAFGRG